MAAFFAKYWGTVLVIAIIAAAVTLIIIKMIKEHKKGRSVCGCGGSCGSCPMGGSCHSKE